MHCELSKRAFIIAQIITVYQNNLCSVLDAIKAAYLLESSIQKCVIISTHSDIFSPENERVEPAKKDL